jgi:hypothetical protein
MEHLPTVGSPLEGLLDDGRTFRFVVEGAGDGVLILRVPADAESPDDPASDLEQLSAVGWLEGRSWYVVPVRQAQPSAGDVPRWRVELAEPPLPTNRRRFVRGGGGEQIQLGDISPCGEQILATGTVVDLSEGGVRCRLPAFGRDRGDDTTVRIVLDGTTIEINGSVRETQTAKQGQGVEAILVFGLTDAQAQAIRRYLFQRELAERRARRD